ncbi:ANTAR domain-containing protein [Actinomycetospora cinnamomea]|uniref:GAF domain-containing protein n=1 Tax=Actinomycetospora cinnamomea TaxID=663609 RepID=A0A2U1EBE6_9PSEU|nr:GAF and ANTAR domain-containing protein [Actinomycetospora cinnamomea]PVY97273.1 GAF domain-containing protein [Actinomycetospora cinnamomea]
MHPGQAEQLVVALRRAAQSLVRQRSIRDLQLTLSGIVAAAVDTVPGATAGGLSVSEDGIVDSRNPTSRGISELDRLQGELHEGPCITALEEPADDGVVLVEDLAGDDAERWPRFAPAAVDAGFRSMLSIQLATGGQLRAALNLYAAQPRVFDGEARVTAGLFALQAAMLLHGSEQAAHLGRAVDSRDVIGQAKGILMERFGVDETEAFQMLVESSQSTNIKLVDVARWLAGEANRRHARRDGDVTTGARGVIGGTEHAEQTGSAGHAGVPEGRAAPDDAKGEDPQPA